MRRLCLLLLLLTNAGPAFAQAGPAQREPSRRGLSQPPIPNTGPIPTQAIPQVVPTLHAPDTSGDDSFSNSVPVPTDPAVWSRQSFTVASCAQPPVLDGKLGDACWKTATRASGFYKYGGGRPNPASEQTEAWICADKTHLYFAFRCLDDHPELIQSSMTQRNGSLGHDDFVGMDIDSQNSRHGYSTFIVTPRGTQLEQLEGGTADNITWAGDWKSAVRRTKRGWTCEMAIPFALLRYPRGAKGFSLVLYRQIGRQTSLQGWPYMPPAGMDNATEPQYLDEFTGFAPPFYTPRPTFLPYTLVTGGTGNSAREGMDIKYPISTTLTGVGTIYPDFQTIEQDVTNINFSYNEKLLTDRRPFFAEGSAFLPDQDLFYSRRINAVDGGLKVVGKQGATTVGLLSAVASGSDAQSSGVVNVQQDLGLYSHLRAEVVDSIQTGLPSSQAARLEGVYGWEAGQTRYSLEAQHSPSWQDGQAQGAKDYYQFANRPLFGHLRYTLSYEDTAPNFDSRLGYNPELDRRGESVHLSQYNQFDKGWLENYSVGATADSYDHHTGGFFHNDLAPYVNFSTRSGLYYELDYGLGRRNQLNADGVSTDHFHDHTLTPNFGWGQKTLYQQGLINDTFGRVAGQSYNLFSVAQGILVSRPFSIQLNYSRQTQGSALSTQTIATGTYRLNDYQTVGGRVVNQAGVDQGTGLGTDIYFSFSQQVRTGTDVFLLFGDPNSPKTRGKFTLKLVHPF